MTHAQIDQDPSKRKPTVKQLRERLKDRPPIDQVVSASELAQAAPFYFALRSFVASLKAARLERGLTLAQLAKRTGLALETLSRLETGALLNPTWQTLGRYASAVGRRLSLNLDASA
jgi:DNA-binding XRE family transcriptional regulator